MQKLLRLNLIALEREEPRQGRPLRYYRAVASGFFIPFEVTSARSLADDWAETEGVWARELGREIGLTLEREMPGVNTWGTHFTTDEQGRLRVDCGPPPNALLPLHAIDHAQQQAFQWPPDVVSWWATLRLTRTQASELAAELQSLFERYYEQAPPPAEPCREYRMRLALTPKA